MRIERRHGIAVVALGIFTLAFNVQLGVGQVPSISAASPQLSATTTCSACQPPAQTGLLAYGPVLAPFATAVAALLGLYGVLLSNRNTLKAQQTSFEKQIAAQRDQLSQQLSMQREQLDRQLAAQRENLERQLTAQKDQFDRQHAATAEQNRQQTAQTVRQELLIAIASALHSICWLTWISEIRPDRIDQGRIDTYDTEMHVSLPKMLGCLSGLTALDEPTAAQLRPFVFEVFTLDAELAQAGLIFSADPIASTKAIEALHAKGIELHNRLVTVFERARMR